MDDKTVVTVLGVVFLALVLWLWVHFRKPLSRYHTVGITPQPNTPSIRVGEYTVLIDLPNEQVVVQVHGRNVYTQIPTSFFGHVHLGGLLYTLENFKAILSVCGDEHGNDVKIFGKKEIHQIVDAVREEIAKLPGQM